MTSHAQAVLQNFKAIDLALQAQGFPATSPWWHSTIERFYRSGRRQLVLRVGRRGGKSSTLCRLAVCETLYGKHVIPKGDVGVYAIVAQNKDEASQRIRTIRAILDDLKVKHHPIDHGIGITGRPLAFKVFAASVAGVSGFTSIGILADEVSKWKDSDTGVNPAKEVLTSIRPTMATQPNARIILSSSPMGRHDAHYDAFEAGEDPPPPKPGQKPAKPFQICAYAPTWVANPSPETTREETLLLEPDPSKWRREYEAIPGDDTAEGIVTAAEIDRVTRTTPLIVPPQPGHEYWAAMDPATSGNAWTLVVGCLRWCPVVVEMTDKTGEPVLDPTTKEPKTITEMKLKRSIVFAREWRGKPGQPLRPQDILHDIRMTVLPYGIDTVYSDEWSFESLYDLAANVGLTLIMESSQLPIKRERYRNLAVYIRSQQADLPPDEQLRQDILNVRRRLTATGERIDLAATQDGRHADFAPAVSICLTRPMSAPTDVLDDQDAELERKKARYEAQRDEAERPPWKPRSGAAPDRGANAFWKR